MPDADIRKAPLDLLRGFIRSEQTAGLLLIAATLVSLILSNTSFGESYRGFWHGYLGPLSIEHWINDALMAVFFLLIGLELEREIYVGELSDWRRALLPALAALGGMLAPAAIHYALNAQLPTRAGFGIPMATDIAFALGVLALLGKRIPTALKVFVIAFAVMDDLGAIIVIAVAYSGDLSWNHLAGALALWVVLLAMNRLFRVFHLIPYLIGGVALWWLMLKSGIHATIAGVMLAFAVPFSAKDAGSESPSHRLEHALQRPIALIVLPLFALANTAIVIRSDWWAGLLSPNGLGILLGLVAGKPLGVLTMSGIAVASGLCRLPSGVGWRHIVGAGMLGGIGFTMSIFITNLAFATNPSEIDGAKTAILLASTLAGTIGFLWLRSGTSRD